VWSLSAAYLEAGVSAVEGQPDLTIIDRYRHD
jgi:hypothetical protein